MGYIDIEKYITLFLSQPGVQSAVTAPNNNIIIMDRLHRWVPMAEMVMPFHWRDKCQVEDN